MTRLAGRGIADITGEAAECGMLGYGKAEQQTTGIHTRLHARAFAFAQDTAEDDRRVLLVVCDLPLISGGLVAEVLRRLPDGWTESNVMITATHTHCGPGGYFHHALYNSNTGGFRPQTYAAIVDGITEAALAALADLAPAELALAHGELHDVSANRSRRAFDRNPERDRAHFPAAVDPHTTLLSIHRDGRLTGAVHWFPVHNTSMTNTNTLISSDNKGYAAYTWERLEGGTDYLDPEPPSLVTAFAQTNAGDMSPNLNLRPGSGPTENEYENTRLAGTRQQQSAGALLAAATPLTGPLDHRITHLCLSRTEVRPEFTGDGRAHRTGTPVGGAAALAGAWADGKGFRGFREGRNPLWDTLSQRVVYALSPALRDAHAPKALVLPAGPLNTLRPMVQERVPVQLLRIGRLHLLGIPGEVTVVAGLRLRRTVADIIGADLGDVLVASYSNGYFHYVTTPEEYDAQEYEGGSTLFGRWQLAALCQTAADLATALRDGRPVRRGVPEPLPAVRPRRHTPPTDTPPPGRAFGDVLSFARIGDKVTAAFVAAHPNNDLKRGATHLSVERRGTGTTGTGGTWTRVADDNDWSTTFRWARTGPSTSTATVTWTLPKDTAPGVHRIRYHGRSTVTGPFTGTTEPFDVP
ncbi:neutral/alkaline non-lysosomal ceramidase N-terminal domain-containing protein [Streptomyces candidus]|uniref:Neutral ceramidase n=1 Tax=Streptomyces candidus TaxID=67283 RepID=A0A7X0LRT9_9ACTN|nr:neutral/alkaline non-lysosomal ceramidase N-terminal domain-containing protein [Streptomyces candidus]MBB6437834.1 neutral ceramidase [Streptomyces candidus]GHH50050.1 neutral ceramidase [Streptomyces candidus]